MGCAEFPIEYILFFAKLLFAAQGPPEFEARSIWDSYYWVNPALVVGGVVLLIAFFGCCGAIRENNCMLITYSIFMIILMVLKITLATIIFVKLDSLLTDIPMLLNQAFNKDQDAFHEIETTFQCCGTTGAISYMDWLPPSCCSEQSCNMLNAFPGCNGKIHDLFYTFGMAIGIVAITVSAIEMVAVVFALCLANHFRNKNTRGIYKILA